MEWTTIIVAIISALVSGGGIAGIANFKENKRAKRLENERDAAAQWRELFQESEKKNVSQSNKIEGLFKTIGDLRDQINSLKTQKAVLTTYKCEALNCPNRQPPFGSQDINK
ncbi:hypothetical protein [uncultured Alistipes sp.]|jgi:hypothetical protein|uniref:hypothetical protein n=1 Tax=uncultured Alistipes sp. TaxID=538949 RepID=UPI0025F6DA32|nr:hypothetical protein [uncultured Alistipes sp.]